VYVAAQEGGGLRRGSVASFARQPDCTTPVPSKPGPAVTTGAASAVTAHGAALAGTVNPQGSPTTYRFEYGLTTAYTAQTTAVDAGAGTTDAAAAATLSGLQEGTVYHYRVTATNVSGTVTGVDRTFSTPDATVTAKRRAPGVTVHVTPGKDRTLPYRFRTSGKIVLPKGVTKSNGCSGIVSVQIKRGTLTLSTRLTEVSKSCKYSSTVTFSAQKRLLASGKLKVRVRFHGNKALTSHTAKIVSVRYG
jgi:hypothetical protein